MSAYQRYPRGGLTVSSHVDVDDAVLVADGQNGALAIGDGGQAHHRAQAVAKALGAGGRAQGHRATGELVVLLVGGHEGDGDGSLGLERVPADGAILVASEEAAVKEDLGACDRAAGSRAGGTVGADHLDSPAVAGGKRRFSDAVGQRGRHRKLCHSTTTFAKLPQKGLT